jgi:hypothetical protein
VSVGAKTKSSPKKIHTPISRVWVAAAPNTSVHLFSSHYVKRFMCRPCHAARSHLRFTVPEIFFCSLHERSTKKSRAVPNVQANIVL